MCRLVFLLIATMAPLVAQSRPNIVIVLADDHGWHETGYNGHPHLKTPVLDEMAANGLRFDRFYAAAPVCSPTRGSILTGRHPNRYGTFAPNYSIRPEERTLGKVMKDAGYATGHFGKWHVGPVRRGSPTNPGALGFDEWLSHDNFFSYNPPLARNGAPPENIPGESSEVVVAEAIQFIKKAVERDQPFFTLVWFGSPHEPYAAIDQDLVPYAWLDRRLRHRFGEIVAMDRAIGHLRDYLEAAGLRDDTLLWYLSDNGTPREVCVWTRLRGSKGNLYEGGIRVPSVLEWPSRIDPRSTEVPAVTSDIMPTICDLLDLPMPDRPIDGISLVPLLEGRMSERPSPIAFWRYDRGSVEGEDPGQWIDPKLQQGEVPTSKVPRIQFRNFRHPVARTKDFGGMAALQGNRYKLVAPDRGPLELYDMENDLTESYDLAGAHPEIVRKMETTLREWQRSVERSLTGADYK